MRRNRNAIFSAIALVTALIPRPLDAAEVVEAVMGVMGCASLKDDKERLSCFDKAVLSLKTAGVTTGPETANTKEIVSSFAAGDFKVVDPDDIHVAPRKFLGKPIELRNVRCFYADKDDYRCVSSSNLTTVIFAKSVEPSDAREALEADCGAIKKLSSPGCRKTVQIVPMEFAEDAPNAFTKRIIVRTLNLKILALQGGRPKR